MEDSRKSGDVAGPGAQTPAPAQPKAARPLRIIPGRRDAAPPHAGDADDDGSWRRTSRGIVLGVLIAIPIWLLLILLLIHLL